MGRKVKHNVRLLERAFSREEWEYLKRHEEFEGLLKSKNVTLDDFEKLSLLGDRLLMKWEKANPSRPRFRRVGNQSTRRKAGSS